MIKKIALSICIISCLTNPVLGLPEEDDMWIICNPIPPKVFPLIGNLMTTFTYTITYTDPEGVAPSFIEVWIDDKIYPMEKSDILDNNYADGCKYQYETRLQAGTHKYCFVTSDGIVKVKTPIFSGPVVMEENYPYPARVTIK